MTNNSMQYLVIQGRAPQDGSEPAKALILCPAWMSATLVCAGITGRIIEMTDGSIVEGRVIEAEGGEEELLAEIRAEFEDEELPAAPPVVEAAYQEAERKIGMPPEMAAPYSADAVVEGDVYENVALCPQDADEYTRGMQDVRAQFVKVLTPFGFPEDGARPKMWIKAQLEQKVTEQRNLDAWRDAAGAAELCIEYDENGMVRKIFGPEESGGVNTSEIAPALNALLLEFGGKPGGDYLEFLREQLEAAANANAVIATLRDDFTGAMEAVAKRDDTIEQLRKTLLKIKKQVKAAL